MTSINNISDLVQVLTDHPEWLHTVRGLIISTEISDLPSKIDEIKSSLLSLEGKVDNHYGAAYESKVVRHVQSIAGQHLQLISVRVLYGRDAGMDADLERVLDEAAERSEELQHQVSQLLACDLIISGRRRGSQEREYAVFEASVTVSNQDIRRAADRARILSELTGAAAWGVAIGVAIGNAQANMAADEGVWAVSYAE